MGCRTEATIEVHANGKTKEVLIFEDDNGQMASVGRTCENLKNPPRSHEVCARR